MRNQAKLAKTHEYEALLALESQMLESVSEIASCKIRICECLHTIERDRLYEVVGARNFKDYLKVRGLPIPYQTARQYASIGQVMLEERKFLDGIGFSEANGICKLRFLKHALSRCSDRQEVANHLLQDSYRCFREFALKDVTGCSNDESDRQGETKSANPCRSVSVCDDTLLLIDQDGHEVEAVWFNPDAFSDSTKYRAFVDCTIALIKRIDVGVEQ